jgi:predicted amidohydrolase YtcJ
MTDRQRRGENVATEADLVVVNGSVITVDPDFTVAGGLAVRDGVISFVGSGEEARALIGPGTRVVDLQGGSVLPGINDSHCHAVSFGLAQPPLTLDLSHPKVRSISDIVELVAEVTRSTRAGDWVVGAGWDPGFLDECLADPQRMPTRQDLDAVSPDNPVFLQDFSYHTAWVNSAALRLGGIDATTVPPPGSMIVTDVDGLPSGILNEGAQRELGDLLPGASDDTREVAIRAALKTLAQLGITSITEPGLGPGDQSGGMGEGGLRVYARLVDEGELTVRVTALLFPVPMSKGFEPFKMALDAIAAEPSADPRLLNVVGVKMLADGIPPNRTAWMHEPYVGGGRGALTVEGETDDERVEQLQSMVAYAHDLGWQVGVHVTGDRGIDAVVDAFAAAVAANPRPDSRHYVIHGDFMTRRSLRLCAEHGFGVNMNPTIKWTIADLEEEFVGPERAAYEWPYRDTIDAGVVVASGSDAPVTFPDWRQGIATMILRESKASGRVSGPDQRITLEEALRTYTINGAWQDFADSWKGSLEVGKVADLCVLEQDLLRTSPQDIPAVEVVMTLLAGRVVFERGVP